MEIWHSPVIFSLFSAQFKNTYVFPFIAADMHFLEWSESSIKNINANVLLESL